MDILKALWPTPFKIKEKNLASFLIQLIIFVIIVAVAGAVIGLLCKLPIIGIIFTVIGSLMGLYSLIGVVLCICKFLGVLK